MNYHSHLRPRRNPRRNRSIALGIITLLVVFSFMIIFKGNILLRGTQSYLASVFFVPSITVGTLQAQSVSADAGVQKIKVLIVPGHEPDYGGAEYHSIKERDITPQIGQDLQQLFDSNPRYQATTTRDANDWNPTFKNYFATDMPAITAWVTSQQKLMNSYIREGLIKKVVNVVHNSAPDNVALRLYGISKWADDNGVDITIHIHINDNPRPDMNSPGKYSGFAIYVPDSQYSNASATRAVADSVFKRLSTYFPVSDLPQESAGEVEDQDLIAIGSNNTVNAVSMLIEYAYIYEPMLSTDAMQNIVAREMAYQTYRGVEDFFGKGNSNGGGSGGSGVAAQSSATGATDTATLPYHWDTNLYKSPHPLSETPNPDIFALQVALTSAGYYPPSGSSRNDCPMTGVFGSCTASALAAFQADNNLSEKTGSAGFFGSSARAVFNQRF